MPGLKVVALISGGKDSFFSILHCQANDHRIVALANLHPPQHEDNTRADDLESYMYQTIGHAIIPLYQKALDLPLYRQEIQGTAVNQDKSYGCDDEASTLKSDETESLIPLLRKVMAAHPEVNAVSTGAILSDYQRTRVESVARRLGLVPLSYLWQWPVLPQSSQSSLLEDMATVGQDARIVKVASGGLNDTFLWQNVADRHVIARLDKAARRFGIAGDGAVLGEGGEYETLAVDGPPGLWKGRIIVDEADTVKLAGEAGSSSLRIVKAIVEMKEQDDLPSVDLRIPAMLDKKFEDILSDLLPDKVMASTVADAQLSSTETESTVGNRVTESHRNVFHTSWLYGHGATATEQTCAIMDKLAHRTTEYNVGLGNVVYTAIVLRTMNDFIDINAVYGSYFTEPNPPARLTIACAGVLPAHAHIAISFTLSRGPKEGLHVQSRSYWAPANIGPYSQATRTSSVAETSEKSDTLIYIAGQIPLVPASMELVISPSGDTKTNFVHEVVVSLQHLVRVGEAMQIGLWGAAIAFITNSQTNDLSLKYRAEVIRHAWKCLHIADANPASDSPDQEDEEFDVWHLQTSQNLTPWKRTVSAESTMGWKRTGTSIVPQLHIIRVDSLPRGSSIEWVSYGWVTAPSISVTQSHLDDLLQLFAGQIVADEP